mgnify:CR=1 FL=1
MPAKYIKRVDKEDGYFHIYNKGVSGKIIFKDEQDYEVFLDYLRDYLTLPAHPDTYKRNFTVKGRTFQGVPHRTKNYFNNINLIAYNLMPNHFHLLLHQITQGSLENLMRSLCTRYSMYFNKKYQSTGPLFEGPYKSVYINGLSPLLHLTRYLHRRPAVNDSNLIDRHSSYAEYLGKRDTLWVKPNIVLSFFNDSKNNAFKGIGGYKNFVEKYEPDQDDNNLLEGIILEKECEHLEGSNPYLASISPSEETQPDPDPEPKSWFIEIAVATAAYVVLFTFGLRNVLVSPAKDIISINTISSPSPTASVEGAGDEKPKIILAVKIDNGSNSINIRQNPSIQSKKIGEAKNGDVFEFVSINSGWYGVKMADGSTGFISSKFIEIIEETSI